MPLLGQQNIAKQQINDYFISHHGQTFWLSGEPGVGKTYIASAFLHDYLELHPQHHALIIVPRNVLNKWQMVLQQFNPQVKIQLIKRLKKDTQINLEQPINIITNHALSQLTRIDNHSCQLVIYDEMHELNPKKTNFQHLSKFLNRTWNYNDEPTAKCIDQEKHDYHPNLLALTGTVFNQQPRELINVLKMTNISALQHYWYTTRDILEFNLSSFINQLWQFISTTINLDNVQANLQKVEIKQDIMPIHLIQLNAEEQAFYDFTQIRMAQLGQRHNNLSSDLLDFPREDQFVTKRAYTKSDLYRKSEVLNPTYEQISLRRIDNLAANINKQNQALPMNRQKEYVSAVMLNQMDLAKTHKFKRLQQIMQANPQQTILILLNGNQHLTRLAKAITAFTDRPLTTLNPNVKAEDRENLINNFLSQHNGGLLIADANQIKTGIDLNTVNIIVWYQLLDNLADILQTQRRARRLNSQQDSKVYYLAYANTIQELLINDLSQSNTRNASAYGARSTDALSQLHGILFKQIQ